MALYNIGSYVLCVEVINKSNHQIQNPVESHSRRSGYSQTVTKTKKQQHKALRCTYIKRIVRQALCGEPRVLSRYKS
jgi:hypothetical protein